ncbi:MAG: PTS sugar transporter subunit IIA [Sediminispirochaetaceae bacterium]
MSDFSELLLEADICELEHTHKYEALHELISCAVSFISLPNAIHFEDEVVTREKKQSTGIGKGIAIAHATTGQVEKIRVALGISRAGIEYDSIDGQPVHLLFLVANPPNSQLEYLSVLSALVRLLREPSFRRSIICCTSACEVKQLIEDSLSYVLSA